MMSGKKLSAILLGILLFFDAVIAYRFFDEGWPKYMKVGSGDAVQVVRVPFTWEDGLIVFGIAVLHVVLIYAVRKSRVVQVRH
jgi:hypothetical protein